MMSNEGFDRRYKNKILKGFGQTRYYFLYMVENLPQIQKKYMSFLSRAYFE